MKPTGGKGIWIVLVVASVAFAAAIYFLLIKKDTPSVISGQSSGEKVPSFATKLALTTMGEGVTITLEVPKGMGPTQEFSGSGVADYPNATAGMTYDLGELVNSAGAFGQLFDFDVAYEGPTTYIEIFKDEPEWLVFHPDEAVGRDIERLREVILSSPLVLPDLLGQLSYRASTDGGSYEGSLDPRNVGSASDTSKQVFDALADGLGVTSIDVTLQVSDDLPTDIEYTYSFPVVAGAHDTVTVTVVVKLEPTSETGVEIPSDDHVRELNR